MTVFGLIHFFPNTDETNQDLAKIWLLFYSRASKVWGGGVSCFLCLIAFVIIYVFLVTGEQDNAVGGGVAAGADGVRSPALLRD
jgi:hypothetical protein